MHYMEKRPSELTDSDYMEMYHDLRDLYNSKSNDNRVFQYMDKYGISEGYIFSRAESLTIVDAKNVGKGKVTIVVTLSNGEEDKLTTFFDDEYYINASLLVGKTVEKAREYCQKIDIAYLQS